MTMVDWNPKCYAAYGDERLRPARDLIAAITQKDVKWLVDLGCGPGNVTSLLATRWPDAQILGIDNSPSMLTEAREKHPGLDWRQADIADWQAERPYDLIFSNAALQWLGDHAGLLPRLLGFLRPGGTLAIQMPRNFDAASHVLLRETMADGPWAARLADAERVAPVAKPAYYYDLLGPHSRSIDIWESIYCHVLSGDDPVLKWTRATALRLVETRLSKDEFAGFTEAYAARLRRAYPPQPDGQTLFPFQRIFIVAEA